MGATSDVVKEIVIQTFKIPDEIADRHKGDALTGTFFKLSGPDMIYLLMLLEKRFMIFFAESDVIHDKFKTINGIAESINKKIDISS